MPLNETDFRLNDSLCAFELFADQPRARRTPHPAERHRDGFSIRVALKDLEARREKNKFLLVFSDGEPAAAGYDQNGIVDTHLAVSEARKKGIDVIGMFLSDGEIGEREDATMENIYGRERVMVPSVAELPEHFAPLLKKLLLKAI